MSQVFGSGLIAGAQTFGSGALGIKGSVIRATTGSGPNGAGWLYDNWDDAGDDDKEFRLEIETWPASGTLFVYEDGAWTFDPVEDGAFSAVGRFYLDGVDQGTETNYLFSGEASATGTLAATEQPDTAAITGAVRVAGSLAATESPDTAAFSGASYNYGTLAATEAPDVAAFTGGGVITGELAATEALDVAALAGTVSGGSGGSSCPTLEEIVAAVRGGLAAEVAAAVRLELAVELAAIAELQARVEPPAAADIATAVWNHTQ